MTKKTRGRAILAQLSKAPILGRVKTRMQPTLSVQQSVSLHKALTEHTIKSLASSHKYSHHLWIDEDNEFFLALEQRYSTTVFKQTKGDLGTRLDAISKNYADQTHVLIGSDCPFITKLLVEEILARLSCEQTDLVMVPAKDGGYVCLALKKYSPELFKGIAWGTEHVAEQTLARAAGLGLKVEQMPALNDIDRPEDLHLLESLSFAKSITL